MVPRTTTSDDSTFFSTGTVMADGAGGAVRAATSAGERMRLAAPQLTSDDRMTAARPMNKARFLAITGSALPTSPQAERLVPRLSPQLRPKIISKPPLTHRPAESGSQAGVGGRLGELSI